jgi:hypothetical protein
MGIIILSESLYIQNVRDRNNFSALLLLLIFMPIYNLIYLHIGYIFVHKKIQIIWRPLP